MLADVAWALDAEELHVSYLQLHAPTLDDVFLTKTGRSLEGAGDELKSPSPSRCPRDPARPAPPPRSPSSRGAGHADVPLADQCLPPFFFPLMLLAVNVGGLQAASNLRGFLTDSYLDLALAFTFLQGALRDDECGH